MTITPRYGESRQWTDALHREQRRKGKAVPSIAHLIAVSSLVWENESRKQLSCSSSLQNRMNSFDALQLG